MGDLTPGEEAAYLRARHLTRPDGIRQTLSALDRHATDAHLPDELRDVLAAAGITIRSLHHQTELLRALLRRADEHHDDK